MPDPIILLMGPTGAGKTELAIQAAETLPVELINVDSALVYQGLDIGAARPSAAELARAPHRLMGFRDPARPYSAADFRADALAEIEAISAAGRIPLLVGGTMLYFKALLEGLAELPPIDPAIREDLNLGLGKDADRIPFGILIPCFDAHIRSADAHRIRRRRPVLADPDAAQVPQLEGFDTSFDRQAFRFEDARLRLRRRCGQEQGRGDDPEGLRRCHGLMQEKETATNGG